MRARVFYGWYIVGASVLIGTFFMGTFMYGFTAMINPIAATFGWSYAQISLARSFQSIETSALHPLVGTAADRWPSKRLMLIGVTVAGLGLLCLSQVTTLAMFYVSFLIVGLGSSFITLMVPVTTVAKWFNRNLSKANSVLALSFGIGGLLVPVTAKIIDTYGWQNSLIIFAVGLCLIGIPLSFVFRDHPEDYGLLPDGKPPEDLKDSGRAQTYDFSLGIKETLRTRDFWLITIAFMLQMGAVGAVIVHVMPYLVSLGIERATAGTITMFIYLVSIAARLLFGWVADIFKKKYVIVTSMVLTSVGLFLFSFINSDAFWLIILFVIIYGISIGGIAPVRPSILREYFGTKKFGTIFGLSSIFFAMGPVVTSPVAGWVFDTRGVYDPIWLIFSGICMMGAILILTISPGQRPSRGLPTA